MPRLILVMLLAALAVANPAHAGQSYDNCSGFIDSVPATITTQGVWCLRADLSTAISSGDAIWVNANNVTIDCNDFKLGGLAAGINSGARGIRSSQMNTSIRNCNIRGFYYGVFMSSGGGSLVESNRFDGNLAVSIDVRSPGSTVRNNQVFDTGGADGLSFAYAIYVNGGVHVIGNTVTGVASDTATSNAYGIGIGAAGSGGASIRDNRISGLAPTGTGSARGIYASASVRITIRDNDVQHTGGAFSVGIRCLDNQAVASRNVVNGFATGIEGCALNANYVNPN